ncbi:hypothetical protein KGQ71_00335 [Patescibacteria group bacterium]|nr:hypothetical protein [Patescibacteria group bacterium]
MNSPRLFLFCGTDSFASFQALRQWVALFTKKYGEATCYTVEADELTVSQLQERLTVALQGDTLFAQAKLILVKRLTAQEKGVARPLSTAFLEVLARQEKGISDLVTVVVWEERALEATHPLRRQFASWGKDGKAETRSFDLPGSREVAGYVQKQVKKADCTIAPDGLEWLTSQYRRIEAGERLRKRLKRDQVLADDDRGWWLYQAVEGGILRNENGMVTAAGLQAGLEAMEEPVGAFSIVEAVRNRQWPSAYALAAGFARQSSDESSYFGLWAALSWHFRSAALSSEFAGYGRRLLAEIELIVKNFPIPSAWLLTLLLYRLEHWEEKKELLSSRRLWLAQLHRSG